MKLNEKIIITFAEDSEKKNDSENSSNKRNSKITPSDRVSRNSGSQHHHYNPYKTPANLEEAKLHKNSNRFGIFKNDAKNIKFCPCCYKRSIDERINMFDCEKKIAAANPTIAVYFKFLKFSMLVLLLNFLLSGIIFIIQYPKIRKCFIFNCDFEDQEIREIYKKDYISKILVIINFIVLLVLKLLFVFEMRKFDVYHRSKRITASNFTLDVRYPTKMSEVELIKEFTNLKKGWKVEKINLVYNINSYSKILQQIIKFEKQLKYMEIKKKTEKKNYQKIKDKLIKKKKELEQVQKNFEKDKSKNFMTGFAFITMSDENSIQEIIDYYGQVEVLLDRQKSQFKVKQAYEPIDIIWDNYGLTKSQSILKQITTNAISLIIIAGCFFCFIFVKKEQITFQETYSLSNLTITILISIFVSVTNILLRFILKIFTSLERHQNYTTLFNEIVKKISFAYFVNTALMFNFSNKMALDDWRVWGKISTSSNITIFMILSILFDGLYDLVDPLYFIKKIKRKIIRNKLKKNKPVFQFEANNAYEGYELDFPERYYQSMKVLSICFFFQPILPYILLVGLVEQMCTFLVQKYIITRRILRPKVLDFKFNVAQIDHFDLCLTAMILGYINFDLIFTGSFNKFTFILICLGSFHWFFNDYDIFIPFFGSSEKPNYKKLSQCYKYFATDYDRMNPVTQKEAYVNWINYLKRNAKSIYSSANMYLSTKKNVVPEDFQKTLLEYLEYKNKTPGTYNIPSGIKNNAHDINLFLIEEKADNNLKSLLFSNIFGLKSKNFNLLEQNDFKNNLSENKKVERNLSDANIKNKIQDKSLTVYKNKNINSVNFHLDFGKNKNEENRNFQETENREISITENDGDNSNSDFGKDLELVKIKDSEKELSFKEKENFVIKEEDNEESSKKLSRIHISANSEEDDEKDYLEFKKEKINQENEEKKKNYFPNLNLDFYDKEITNKLNYFYLEQIDKKHQSVVIDKKYDKNDLPNIHFRSHV